MIQISLQLFKSIKFEDCINLSASNELDKLICKVVSGIIESGKRKSQINKLTEDEQIDHMLKQVLVKIVPSSIWQENADKKTDQIFLYTLIKKHYFIKTCKFPE